MPCSNRAADTTTLTGIGGTVRYHGAVLGRDGLIYGIPRNTNNVIRIDPKSNGSFCSALTDSAYFKKD